MFSRFIARVRICAAVAALAASASTLRAQAAPAEPPKPKNLEGAVALGFSLTSGNASATTTNVTNKLKYSVKGWSVSEDLTFFYGEADNKVNANFWNGGVRGERRLAPRLGFFVATRFDRNVLQGIATRFEEGVGLDIKAIDAPMDKLNISLGGSAFQQSLTKGSTSVDFKRSFPAARAAADYKHSFSPLAFFQQTAEYLPNLSDTNSYLLNSESSLVAPLKKSLAIKVAYVVRYNSTPPVRDNVSLKTTDTYFSSGLTYSF
jgi:putative salt-induced outer membrane protein